MKLVNRLFYLYLDRQAHSGIEPGLRKELPGLPKLPKIAEIEKPLAADLLG
jgi:hypothetical protein